jgi:hypothetical protein
MSADTILCHQCGKDLVMKFIELKDLVFCSSACFENFKTTMSRKDFFKKYGDGFKPDEQKWVPKYSNDYIKMCGYCPPKLAEACRSELDISGVFHDDVIDTETMHWCCHARFVLSASMSDGSVPAEVGKKVQARAEELAKKEGIRGVTPISISNAFADLGTDFEYKKLKENPPEPKELEMSHAAACLLCNPDFAKECEVQVEKEFQLVGKAKALVKGKGLWCSHVVQSLAEILIDRENGEEAIKNIINLTEKVAQEKGHPGVITRDLFIAMGRSIPSN